MNNIKFSRLCVTLIALFVVSLFLCFPVEAAPEECLLPPDTTPVLTKEGEQRTGAESEPEIPYELDIKGRVSAENVASSTSAKLTVVIGGADINQVKAVCLNDGRQLERVKNEDTYVFEVKANGTYSVSVLLNDDSILELEESAVINCIDTIAPSVKSVSLPIDPISKGVAVVKATASDGHPGNCDSSFGGVARLYITEFGSATTVSDTNSANSSGQYCLEINKNGKYTIYAVDKAGNVSQGYTVSVGVFDTRIPVIEIVSIEYNEEDTSIIDVLFKVTDDNEITSIKVTDEEGKAIERIRRSSAGYGFSVTKNGVYVIVATDSAGNKSQPFDVEIELVDITPPTISFGASEYSEDEGSTTIPFTVTDESGLSMVYVNGEQVNNLKREELTYSGSHKIVKSGTLEVLAYDLAGNSSYEYITVSEADAPMPVIISLDVTEVTDTSAVATVTTESNVGLRYEWYIQESGGKWDKLAGEKDTINLYGLKRHTDYSVQVVVYNSAGNSVTATASFTTESMGVLYEGNDSWMLYVAIAVVVVFAIIVVLFSAILKKGKKR